VQIRAFDESYDLKREEKMITQQEQYWEKAEKRIGAKIIGFIGSLIVSTTKYHAR